MCVGVSVCLCVRALKRALFEQFLHHQHLVADLIANMKQWIFYHNTKMNVYCTHTAHAHPFFIVHLNKFPQELYHSQTIQQNQQQQHQCEREKLGIFFILCGGNRRRKSCYRNEYHHFHLERILFFFFVPFACCLLLLNIDAANGYGETFPSSLRSYSRHNNKKKIENSERTWERKQYSHLYCFSVVNSIFFFVAFEILFFCIFLRFALFPIFFCRFSVPRATKKNVN